MVKVQNASTENALVDIRFCPAKGAKPQTAHRPDTLYQDISPTMCFNVKYTTTRKVAGSKLKVPDIETNQPRSVLLAYNLDLTREGRFGQQPRVGSHGESFNSLQFAKSVIDQYYQQRQQK